MGKRKNVKKEYRIENYKSDLYIDESRTIIEVKSILSFDREASFPTVYSQRAINQLTKLSNLLDSGYQVCYIFMSLSPRVKNVKINKDVPEYYKLLLDCLNKGMSIKGYTIKLQNAEPVMYSKIKVIV